MQRSTLLAPLLLHHPSSLRLSCLSSLHHHRIINVNISTTPRQHPIIPWHILEPFPSPRRPVLLTLKPPYPFYSSSSRAMPGLVTATGVLGFLSDEEPELKVFALQTLNDDIDTVWTEVAGALSQMCAVPPSPLSLLSRHRPSPF